MDTRTGEIKSFKDIREEMEKGLVSEEDLEHFIELGNKPDLNCKKCHGLGHIGKDVETGKYIPCLCARPKGKLAK